MTAPGYPFAAIVGQAELKLALLLAGVDWRLSVLLKGDKGSGKTTAARALGDILPSPAPFVNLPIGTTEDRLLGALDLDSALQGQAQLKRGLIHESHGGVLYIDEVNLLSDSLTDALLDVASSGRHHVERDGFSAVGEARFILLASMNIEEGSLRPQLLDRFALSLDVETPVATGDRVLIVEARLHYDADPSAFCGAYEQEQQRLRRAIAEARSFLPGVKASCEVLQKISQAVTDAGVRSLRADLAALRAAIARAALESRAEVTQEDLDSVLPLVLHHRAKHNVPQPPTSPPPPGTPNEPGESPAEAKERVFPPEPRRAPELRVALADSVARGRTAKVQDDGNGETTRSAAPPKGNAIDVVASFTQSFRNTGTASLQSDHLVFRTPRAESGVRFIFAVDASGSHAAQQRMRAVKGAAAALLESSVDNKDEVAVISFRGAKAEIVLEPCRDAQAALRVLEFLPTGGRTPLAHALELAISLVNQSSVLVLLTDGRANVALNSNDPWADALQAAKKLTCSSIIIDSSIDTSTAGALEALAAAMRARLIRLDDLSQETLMSVLHL